ncbi:MAG: DUF853 domain-containing protein [Actinomycetota bacterium]|nr:DUF853 domain-containing protein [Actinomycetota bacterium]
MSEVTQRIAQGYIFDGPALELGAVVHDGTVDPRARIRILLAMMNRHGLIAGATGTGKTKTLQLMAEQLSTAGVAVFAPDIKSDLSGLVAPGESNDKIAQRVTDTGDSSWAPTAYPTEFFALGGVGTGTPLRATVTSFGPILLSKVLGLNDTQESALSLMFHWSDQNGLALLDLADLRAVIGFLTSDEGSKQLKELGGVAKSTAGVILREISELAAQGAEDFFGEPEFDTADLLRLSDGVNPGRGIINLLELSDLQDRPALFSTFLMWLLADLYGDLPEVGDLDKPKLVFFFDEAHLLFDNASPAFLDAVGRTVRLVRSKGVGVFFVTQRPDDVPDDVLAQLGNRIQHALRAYTPDDADALRKAVRTYPISEDYDLEEVLTQLGTGEAVVTVMSERGAPTPVAWCRMPAPRSLMAPARAEVVQTAITGSALHAKYAQQIDRDSAYERLSAKVHGTAAPDTKKDEPPRQDEPSARRRGQPRDPIPEPSIVEQIVQSGAFKSFMRSAGSAIGRRLFGTASRRR